jgi:hypothetical protein
MKKFIYMFALGGKVVWSGDTEEVLRSRADNDVDKAEVEQLIESGEVGSFICLETGEMAMRTE